MKYLFLDTSQFKVMGQIGGDTGFRTFAWETRRDLANRITTMIDEMLAAAGTTLEEIEVLSVCSEIGRAHV